MATSEFDVEQLRLRAARSLPPHCFDDFQRLSRTLLHGPQFQWLLVDAPHESLRQQVMLALDQVLSAAGLAVNRLPLSGRIDDVPALEARLVNNAGKAAVVHVIGRPGWFTAARWDAFNARRERLAGSARARLVFWLDAAAIELASRGAPDLWAWRAGVYAFVQEDRGQAVTATESRLAQTPPPQGDVDTRSAAQRHRRIAAIEGWLQAHPDAPDELLIAPLDELGVLLYDLRELDAAIAHWRQRELPLHRRRGDARSVAVTQGKIADVLQTRGQLDEALRIRREEELPVFEQLGDVRALAVTKDKIAAVLQARGQLEEALRIRREEVLPAFERLGNVRGRAIILGKIADVLQDLGQTEEALRIRREEVLPVLEQVGDVRERAHTQRKIADLLVDRGQLDEALRIRREEELPVFEQLGDVRERALTQGRIADVLEARGQLDEALRIRRDEELPVYEQLGDVRSSAITRWQIGSQLAKSEPPQREQAQALMDRAYAELAAMKLPEAEELALEMQRLGLVCPPTGAVTAR